MSGLSSGITNRARSNSEDKGNAKVLHRQETSNFKYGYCDYDMSELNSITQPPDSDKTSVDLNLKEIVADTHHWFDKSSAAYFTSEATRNAQTVSWHQRHRPIFLLFLDLITGIFILALMMISVVVKIRNYHRSGVEELKKTDFDDVLGSQLVRIFATAFFFLKFFGFVTWYKCKGEGNVMESTKCVYWTRQLCDMLLYAFIVYMMMLETQLE